MTLASLVPLADDRGSCPRDGHDGGMIRILLDQLTGAFVLTQNGNVTAFNHRLVELLVRNVYERFLQTIVTAVPLLITSSISFKRA